MNSTKKISGYTSSLMILSGAFFKFKHWPGDDALIQLGVFNLIRIEIAIKNTESAILSQLN